MGNIVSTPTAKVEVQVEPRDDEEGENVPIPWRRRVRHWASSELGSLTLPQLGSLERERMLNHARGLEKEADALDDALDEKIEELTIAYKKQVELLRQEGFQRHVLLREEAFRKRVLCAPINSLPLETLSRILTMTTGKSFAFKVSWSNQHPLMTVCRAWRNIIIATPNIWSRITIHIPDNMSNDKLSRVERQLTTWLARAKKTALDVEFSVGAPYWVSKSGMDHARYSKEYLQVIWLQLLSCVDNWQAIRYTGSGCLLRGFWECSNRAERLKSATFDIKVPSFEEVETRSELNSSCPDFPRLRKLHFAHHFPPDSLMETMAHAASLEYLTLKELELSAAQLATLSSWCPFVTVLHLEGVRVSTPLKQRTVLSFHNLKYCHLSGGENHYGRLVRASALRSCNKLTTLHLDTPVIQSVKASHPFKLPLVERLTLELDSDSIESTKFRRLFSILPSLKSLHFSSHQRDTCHYDTDGIIGALLRPTEAETLPLCPDLIKVCFVKAKLSNRALITFIEQRTFDATPEQLDVLEKFGRGYKQIGHWWVRNLNRDTIYQNWRPKCVVTTYDCSRTPDMTNAGLHVLAGHLKNRSVKVNRSKNDTDCGCDESDDPQPYCECRCGAVLCDCCQGRDRYR